MLALKKRKVSANSLSLMKAHMKASGDLLFDREHSYEHASKEKTNACSCAHFSLVLIQSSVVQALNEPTDDENEEKIKEKVGQAVSVSRAYCGLVLRTINGPQL